MATPRERCRIEITPELALANALINLPPHLVKTYIAAFILDKPTNALEVSKLTHKARAQESSYLNQLVLCGYLNRTRQKRIVLFTVKEAGN